MGIYGGTQFTVKATDRLDGTELSVDIGSNEHIRTQEDAEVHVGTMATPFGNTHPGFEIEPKDEGKFNARLQKWVEADPDRAARVAERGAWAEANPEQANKLRQILKEGQRKADASVGKPMTSNVAPAAATANE
jgi:hypothetical protein